MVVVMYVRRLVHLSGASPARSCCHCYSLCVLITDQIVADLTNRQHIRSTILTFLIYISPRSYNVT